MDSRGALELCQTTMMDYDGDPLFAEIQVAQSK